MRLRVLFLVALCLLTASACKKPKPTPTPHPGGTTASSSPPPAPPQPPIRDNSSTGDPKSGASVRVRVLVSNLTPKDPLRFVFQLAPETPITRGHPWLSETLDWSKAVAALHFELKSPSGKTRTLVAGAAYARAWPTQLAHLTRVISIDGGGLSESLGQLGWREPAPDLFSETGSYSLAITGELVTGERTLPVASKPVSFEVKPYDAAERKSVAEVEALAAKLIADKEGLSVAPKPTANTIDDVNGNLWTRFQIHAEEARYDVEVVEVLLTPAGKELAYDKFHHFTCVAEGTPIDTPAGRVPIEQLVPGDLVRSFDVESGLATQSVVEHVESAHAERLHRFGELLVTGNHPVFADGRWQRADSLSPGAILVGAGLASVPAEPQAVLEPAQVYDLSVSAPHTYFAGGLLVHNKAVPQRLGEGEPYDGVFYRRAAKRP